MKLKAPDRKCGSCTACCEGWLWGSAHDKSFFPGKKCHFVCSTGCSIYNQRPEDPCRTFSCAWLTDQDRVFPEWFRPDLSGVVMKYVEWKEGEAYLEVWECGKKIDSSVLVYLILLSMNDGKNISVQVDRGWYHFGSEEFLATKS